MATIVTVNDPLIAPARATAQQAIDWGRRFNALAPYADYLNELYRLAPLVGIDALLLAAQSSEETSHWTSPVWAQRRNPAGIGWTGDAAQNAKSPIFATGVAAARAHVAHALLYATGRINRGGLTSADDARYADYRDEYGTTAAATKLADLAGKWAVDPGYAISIAAHGNGILAIPISAPAPSPEEGTPVTTTPAYTYFPTPVRKQLLPVGWPTRPGSKLLLNRGWIGVAVHETGNESPGANAAMHANWVRSQDAVNSSVSISFFVDQNEIVQITPLDEITWHAGDGCNDPATDIGCFYCISIEKCVPAGANEAKANENLAELIARLGAGDPSFDWGGGGTKGKVSLDHIYRHIDLSQEVPPHHCPDHLINGSVPGWTWATLMTSIEWFVPYVNANLKRATPVPTPTPKPKPDVVYAKPQAVPAPQTFRTIAKVTPRKSATRTAAATGPELPVGAPVEIARVIFSQSTRSVWWVDSKGSRYPIEAFIKAA